VSDAPAGPGTPRAGGAPADPDGPVQKRRRAVEAAFADDGALAGAVPGFRRRSSQAQMALAVFDAISERGTLAAEAGTGTGKTLAYLVPAVLAGGKVLIAAGTKNLQDQIFEKDLPAVCRALNVRVETAILKGRQNYLCRLRLERTRAAGLLESLDDVRALQHIDRFARTSTTGDRAELAQVPEGAGIWPAVTSTRDNCLGSECEHFEECFVVRARRRALAADIVVVNHHLLLADMALRETTDSELLPNADVVIVDEAHHLTRVAGEFFGDGWSLTQVAELATDTLRVGLEQARDGAAWPDLVRGLEQAARTVRLRLSEAGAQRRLRLAYDDLAGQHWDAAAPIPAAIAELDRALGAVEAALAQNAGREAELDLLAPRLQRLRQLMQAWHTPAVPAAAAAGAAVVRWVSATAHGAQFHATPLSCAEPFARARAQREQAWILTSATLTTGQRFEPFLRELGLPAAVARRWDSPFDFARQALLYLPEAMPNPQSEQFAELVAEAAWPVLRASRGRAFVLCSTLRAVARVGRHLESLMAAAGDRLPLLVQGESSRSSMLAQFRRLGDAVLVGSVSFWEGIDVRGDALSVVVIDKLPFAPPDDPVVAARIEQLRRQGHNAFQEYQLPHAVTLLRQGVGRLIRDDADRGVLMILDERLLSRAYGKVILASLPPFARTRDEAEACAFVAPRPGPGI
jgi:ATP-dependent DNA helicase DinG